MSEYVREVEALVADRHEIVSYKWLSDNFDISVESARKIILEAFQLRPDKYDAVFCVVGITKADSRLTVQLIMHEDLTKCLKSYDSVSSFCLYCLGPNNSISLTNLVNSSQVDIAHLFQKMRVGPAQLSIKTEDVAVKLEHGFHRASDEGASRKSASKNIDDRDLMSPSKRRAKERGSKRETPANVHSSRKKPKMEQGAAKEETKDSEGERPTSNPAKASDKTRSSLRNLSRGRQQTLMTSFFSKKA